MECGSYRGIKLLEHAMKVVERIFEHSVRQQIETVASLPALGPWAPPAERGPLLESIYQVSLTVDLCEGNKIISFNKFISPQPVGGPLKRKKIWGPWARAQCAHWLRRPWIEIDDMQFGFMKGKGTADATFIVRQMQKNFRVKGKRLYVGFVDLEKAFNRVQNEQLEQVDMFLYLGSLITEDGECTMDFNTTFNRGQAIRASLQKIQKSQHTDFNGDTTNQSASVACSNVQL